MIVAYVIASLVLIGMAIFIMTLKVGNSNYSAFRNDVDRNITISLIAKNAAFNTSAITVPAGANITINLDNDDIGISRNFAVYDAWGMQRTIFTGNAIIGPGNITYTFKAPETPGSYFFRCDFHPERMPGRFTVV